MDARVKPAHDEVFMTIRAPKDFWSGVMFIAFAAVGILAARSYSLGSAGQMGPGYFPLLLAIVLAFIGVVLIGRSFVVGGEGVGPMAVVPLAVIAVAVAAFGLMIERLGMVIALSVVTVLSSLASRESRLLEAAVLAAVLTAFSVGVFAYGLRLPLPVWPAH
jgi:hypothetical protein